MKILSLFALAAFLSINAMALKVGDTAPTFTLKDAEGKDRSLSEFNKDSWVVLEWYNKDCPFVRKHYDSKNMQNLQGESQKLVDKSGKPVKVAWLQINSSATGKQGYLPGAETKTQAAKEGSKATALLLDTDGTVGKAYQAKTTPHMYLITPTGKIAFMGGIDSIKSSEVEDVARAKPFFKLAMNTLTKGGSVPANEASPEPYGCGIKYK